MKKQATELASIVVDIIMLIFISLTNCSNNRQKPFEYDVLRF